MAMAKAETSFQNSLGFSSFKFMTISELICHYIRRLTIILFAFLSAGSFLPCKGQKQPDLAQPFHLKWAYETNSGVNITPATDGETIYAPLKTGNIISIRFNNGAFLWERENGGRISAVPIADRKGVYIATEILQFQPQSSIHQVLG